MFMSIWSVGLICRFPELLVEVFHSIKKCHSFLKTITSEIEALNSEIETLKSRHEEVYFVPKLPITSFKRSDADNVKKLRSNIRQRRGVKRRKRQRRARYQVMRHRVRTQQRKGQVKGTQASEPCKAWYV